MKYIVTIERIERFSIELSAKNEECACEKAIEKFEKDSSAFECEEEILDPVAEET